MRDLIGQSLKTMTSLYDNRRENIIAFSGGKDSIVLWHLAVTTKLPFTFIYSNTTIDPPGHISFIRNNYSNVIILQPARTFYQLIERKGLPTRHRRFCCEYLKEYVGKGAKVFEGLRIDEGKKRGKRLSLLKEPEVCDTRIKGKTHAYPIMQWSENNVWDYIKSNGLPYPKHYDLGFNRLGCIGCPLANDKQRIREYKMFPRYAYAVIKAIQKNISSGGNMSKTFTDPYEAFYWWVSGVSIENHKTQLFEIEYETVIKETFPL